ncbi:MBL fold metallo-hydrolase [Paenibacillus wulumuqiensis]|uniref:MBL fold metallo-hydrolase n=1 Tax=Paenibacillus wulumuqiensis TaxID=1567107 RepID=UPI00061A0957|nr:MBL fold metallo-hydrolase [Paenibacillus wulumuqiensis]
MVKRLVRLADHVFRLSLPLGEGKVNSYLFEGANGYTVVDTGMNDEVTRRNWQELIANGLVIEKVVITHGHPDHIGLARWFQQEIGVPVIYSRNGYEKMKKHHAQWLELSEDDHTPYAFNVKYDGPEIAAKLFYRHMGSGFLEPDQLYVHRDRLMLGDTEYEAIWTPGHAADHFCFWNAELRILISGDMLFADTAPMVPCWTDDDRSPLEDYFRSLEQIGDYPAELVLPGHEHIIHDLGQRIRDLRNAHHFRMQQLLGMMDKEGKTAGQLCRELYGHRHTGTQELLEFYTALSRLMYLQHEGFAESFVHNHRVYFRKV